MPGGSNINNYGQYSYKYRGVNNPVMNSERGSAPANYNYKQHNKYGMTASSVSASASTRPVMANGGQSTYYSNHVNNDRYLMTGGSQNTYRPHQMANSQQPRKISELFRSCSFENF